MRRRRPGRVRPRPLVPPSADPGGPVRRHARTGVPELTGLSRDTPGATAVELYGKRDCEKEERLELRMVGGRDGLDSFRDRLR